VALLAACSGSDSSGSENGRISFGRFDPTLNDSRIWTSEADGSDEQPLVQQVSWVSDWSPDGRRLVFEDATTLKTIAPDGSDSRVLIDSLGWQAIPKWSPTDEWITFEGSPEKPADPINGSPGFKRSVWVIRPDGTDLHRVTDRFDVEPFFSSDGKQVAFNHVVKPGPSQTAVKSIEVVELDGSGRREIVPPTAGLEHGDWSPDGEWIVYDIETLGTDRDQPPGRGAIWAVRPDGSDRHMLVTPNEKWYAFVKPAWSPDGKQILAGCNTPGGVDRLCAIDAKTSDVTLIIDHSTERQPVNYPAWGSATD
jgi:Tol biopolymer transport system component